MGVSVSESESETVDTGFKILKRPIDTLASNCHVIHTWKSSLRNSISM